MIFQYVVMLRSCYYRIIPLANNIIFFLHDDQRHMLKGTMVSVEKDLVRKGFNYSMVGIILHFKVKNVIDVREATAEEVNLGRAHGASGNHHCFIFWLILCSFQ